MYRNAREFKQLIEYYLAHPEERRKKAEQAYQITRERFAAGAVIGKWQRCCKILPLRLRNGSNGFGTGEAMPRAGV